jgi:curli production assembly/transport component CsgG
MFHLAKQCALLPLVLLGLSACASLSNPDLDSIYRAPELAGTSSSRQELRELPPPAEPIAVSVYSFDDQTGQFKGSEGVTQTLSRALTQGATSILIQSLRDAGQGKWFMVLERENLDNLLKERQIIAEMRQRYLGETTINPAALPSMLFAGILLEGGVVGYDSNTVTGGAGARLLGVGASTEYRQDTITVYLRAVATKTGEILSSVVVRKTVISVGVNGGAFRYISYKNLLETEAGMTLNEPRTVALEQAIQKATRDLILDAASLSVWAMADQDAAQKLLSRYEAEKDGRVLPATATEDQAPAAGKTQAAADFEYAPNQHSSVSADSGKTVASLAP